MKKAFTSLTIAASAAALLAGCAADGTMTNTGKNSAIGAVIGAGLGTVVGNQVGDRDNRTRATGAAVGAALGAAGGYLWSQRMEQQKQAMQQVTAGTPVQVSQTADNRLKINIPADAGFATNSAVLNANMYPILQRLAQTLNQNPAATVSVVGHTDSTGSDAINNPLSQRRADAAKAYLVSQGVAASRIATSGAGSTQPIASNATVDGRAQNRRVEIFVAEPAAR
ncbi:OmpA family protein [Brachymonas denitrificans]|jgi:outer membrane protein OmpA-like peptidoglycan-associated protein|uniref:Outer membrane protein OmpA n=1 Tax=Brachymonas denitrificans DSM 15123 TaxID=1121117 RepID=A0A1H8JN40_9BURK|nr:OmpA family protein [Brachymonas denitrificans]SEN81726.1 Outer membrane protein OmpA [Brachymonas denitrificans DSM 15123]